MFLFLFCGVQYRYIPNHFGAYQPWGPAGLPRCGECDSGNPRRLTISKYKTREMETKIESMHWLCTSRMITHSICLVLWCSQRSWCSLVDDLAGVITIAESLTLAHSGTSALPGVLALSGSEPVLRLIDVAVNHELSGLLVGLPVGSIKVLFGGVELVQILRSWVGKWISWVSLVGNSRGWSNEAGSKDSFDHIVFLWLILKL